MSDTYNEEESVQGSNLEAEYDASFDDDERVSNFVKLSNDSFTCKLEKIQISQIGLTDPIKKGRLKSITGLTSQIKKYGVLVPIHVMTVSEDAEDDDYKYILLDGLRRMYGSMRNGIREIDAIVWDFKDKEAASDLSFVLSLMLNAKGKRQWTEIWDLYKTLELQPDITLGTIESLLQLEPGDAMKLKDIMGCDYDEVKEALLTNKKPLEACYRMLQKLRKEENLLLKEDQTVVGDGEVDGLDAMAKDNSDDDGMSELTDSEVTDLLEMSKNLDDVDNLEETDFKELNEADEDFVDAQVVGERHPLDFSIKQAVLSRDDFTCACCGMKMVGARTGLIAVHHKIPVHCHGKDTLDNLVTLCLNCHITLHIMERNGGSILMSHEDWLDMCEKDGEGNILYVNAEGDIVDESDEGAKPSYSKEQLALIRARNLAKIAINSDKKAGLTKEQVKKATSDAIKHPMPGTGKKENDIAYKMAQKDKKAKSSKAKSKSATIETSDSDFEDFEG